MSYKDVIHSKICFIPDKGGKTRVVALGDVFTQTALAPIHNIFMKLLDKVPADCSYDQPRGAERLRQQTMSGRPLVCLDLKNCTDRFPVSFQRVVMSSVLGEDIADLWHDVCVRRDFDYEHGKVRYAVGQPMGFLSSWAVMT